MRVEECWWKRKTLCLAFNRVTIKSWTVRVCVCVWVSQTGLNMMIVNKRKEICTHICGCVCVCVRVIRYLPLLLSNPATSKKRGRVCVCLCRDKLSVQSDIHILYYCVLYKRAGEER